MKDRLESKLDSVWEFYALLPIAYRTKDAYVGIYSLQIMAWEDYGL